MADEALSLASGSSTFTQAVESVVGSDRDLATHVSPTPLHQSWAWGEVQRRVGWPPERVRLSSEGRAQILIRGARDFERGYVPRGPVPPSMEAILELVRWARVRRLVMLRVEPEGPAELAMELSAAGFRRGPLMEARRTAIVDLHDDESMLSSFRKSSRYNLRVAERSGVVVDEVTDPTELSRQARLTAERHRVYITGAAFHRAVFDILPHARVYIARLGGEDLAAALVAYHDRRAYYLVSGSSGLGRESMPNYALQWRILQDARDAGCIDYDLCGLPATDQPDDPWHNLKQFKTGFGGRIVEYPGTWDIVLDAPRYWVMRRVSRARQRSERLFARARSLRRRPA